MSGRVLAGVVAGSCLALAGCPSTERGQANGLDQVLFFSEVQRGDLGGVPVGATRTITVSRYTDGAKVCEPSLEHGGGDCSGGASEDAISIESASCEGMDCAVAFAEEGSKATLRVSSKTAGSTQLRVTAKSRDGGDLHTDKINVRFAVASKIAVRGREVDLIPLAVPVFLGVRFRLFAAPVVDADGNDLLIDGGWPKPRVEGDALEVDNVSALAKKPGVAKITWEVPGVITRTLDVEVVDPSPVSTLVVFPKIVHSELPTATRIDLDAFTAAQKTATPITAIDLAVKGEGFIYFPVLVVIPDGRRAVVPMRKAEISPSLASTDIRSDTPWAVQITEATGPGSGTFRVEAGAAVAELPIRFNAAR